MQIAKIVPKIRTQGEGIFDYAIPPQLLPDIKIGLLVLVPFGNRKIEGVVIEIKRSSQILKLKSIISIIDNNPVIDKTHTELAKWMSEYYLEPFSKCLFESIVPPAKRAIKNQINTVATPGLQSIKKGKKYLIRADFKDRLNFYLRTIKKTLTRKQSIIILVPDLSAIPIFTAFLKEKISILHAGLTVTERWQTWNQVRSGEVNIVIGSNSALFAPIANLGLIIIDQDENETYKSDQSPRYHVYEVAKHLAEISGANLVVGSITPSITTYFEAQKNKFLYEKINNDKNITLVDMNLERSILSGPLSNMIEKNIANNQKMLLALNRKGEGSALRCDDCGWIFKCPLCNLPLSPTKQKGVCANCEKEFPLVTACEKCKSVNLKNKGISTNRLHRMVLERWPQAKIIQIEKSASLENNKLNLSIKNNWNIAIATNFALKASLPRLDYLALIDADQGLNSPSFRAEEINFQTQYKFLCLAPESIIQTHLPQSPYFTSLVRLNFKNFYEHQLENRFKYNFPPYCRIVELSYRDKDDLEAEKIAKSIFLELENIIKLNKLNVDISGPIPTLRSKKRNYFYQQIILKFRKTEPILFQKIKKLKSGWTINVDPFNLD